MYMLRRLSVILILCIALTPLPAFAHYEGELLPDSVAEMEYAMIISMAAKDTVTRNKLGMVYIRQGKLNRAKAQFMDILKIDPKNFDALDSLGLVSDKAGDFRQAAEWYKKALDIKKGDPGVKKRLETALGKVKGE